VSIFGLLTRGNERVALATDYAVKHFNSGARKRKGDKYRYALTRIFCKVLVTKKN